MRPSSIATAAAFALLGCGDDVVAPAPSASEHGRWDLLAATRDGRPIGTLESAYFAFDTATGRLTTNLLREDLTVAYRRERSAIVTDGPPELRSLDVLTLTDSTLSLATAIRGAQFELDFVPAVPQRRR